jgi:hypothetical protein
MLRMRSVKPGSRTRAFKFNMKKFLVLELFNRTKRLCSKDLIRALNISQINASWTLLHYWRNGYLSRAHYYTGKAGRPPFIYSRTPKGYLRYTQYKNQLERGYPLNLHKYRPVDISDIEASDLFNVKDDREGPEDEPQD